MLNTWVSRRLTKPLTKDSEQWRELAEEEIRHFVVILNWWIKDPRNEPAFVDRVQIIRYTGQQPELAWLNKFWNSP